MRRREPPMNPWRASYDLRSRKSSLDPIGSWSLIAAAGQPARERQRGTPARLYDRRCAGRRVRDRAPVQGAMMPKRATLALSWGLAVMVLASAARAVLPVSCDTSAGDCWTPPLATRWQYQ